jgi:hypothetical protein
MISLGNPIAINRSGNEFLFWHVSIFEITEQIKVLAFAGAITVLAHNN